MKLTTSQGVCLSLLLSILLNSSCTENYSNGERIGLITNFTKKGYMWKSWEGHLNPTQTGFNSTSQNALDFSIDNDNEDTSVVAKLDSAAKLGWKIRLTYHETMGKNWWGNRGHTDEFVTKVDVLDRDPVNHLFQRNDSIPVSATVGHLGHVVDTIYVIIVPKSKIKE